MDKLREKQRRMDLQKMPAKDRNNISNGLKGTKSSVQHNNNLLKALKGKKLSVEQRVAIRDALSYFFFTIFDNDAHSNALSKE